MKRKPQAFLAVVLTAVLIFAASPVPTWAATYRDVPATHYAFAAVDWVSNPVNGSIMVGDTANNFNPTKTVDKFDAAKIFAVAAGYKYASATATASEQELYARTYETYRSLLNSMAAQYTKWNQTADREIAYLLYEGILTTTDVSRFVTKANTIETVNNLTKQEAILYMVRLDGKQAVAEAITLPYHTPYRDDAQIGAEYKKYVYYAKEAGIDIGSDGYVAPNRSASRAELARMFYNMLRNRPGSSAYNPSAPTSSTVTGVIDSVYLDTHVYITAADNVPRIYKLAANAVVMVDGVQRAAAFLTRGMNATALLNVAGEITSLTAGAGAVVTPTPTPAANLPTAGLMENEGYVTAVSGGTVTIRTQRVKLSGEILSEEVVYTVAANCIIQRGSAAVTYADIKVNDIVTFRYSGSVVQVILMQEKDRTILGTLTEKKYVDATSTPVLVVEDQNKVKHELRVTRTTVISRNGTRGLDWSGLRVGDEVEARCEYDMLVDVYARGNRSSVSGTLEELHLTRDYQSMVIRLSDRSLSTHLVTPDTYDVSTLRIGSELRLSTDSLEVYDVVVLSGAAGTTPGGATVVPTVPNVYGYVQQVYSNSTFILVDLDRVNTAYTVTVTTSTVDQATGYAFSASSLRVNQSVYVEFTAVGSGVAKLIKTF